MTIDGRIAERGTTCHGAATRLCRLMRRAARRRYVLVAERLLDRGPEVCGARARKGERSAAEGSIWLADSATFGTGVVNLVYRPAA